MERLPTLQYQLLGEFHTLLDYPSGSPAISRSNLLQMMTINIFAIGNLASQGNSTVTVVPIHLVACLTSGPLVII